MGPEVNKPSLITTLDMETPSRASETSTGDPKPAPVAPPYDWKALLNSLPSYSFRDANTSRRVTYYNDLHASNLAALRLAACDVIGIDAEWKPVRKSNETSHIALVQVAGYGECQLHHVHRFPFFPPNLREVLENPNILKVGAGIEQDVRKLRSDWGVEVKSYLDLSPLALELDPFWGKRAYRPGSMIALARLAARYLKRCVDKEQQCSNWENRDLTESQQTYAANDGCAVLDVYYTLMSIHQGNQSLEELDYVPITPSSASSTSLPPSEALPPTTPPSILQLPTPAPTPPRSQLVPSYSPSQTYSVLTSPPMYGPGPHLATPPLYQNNTSPMFQNSGLVPMMQIQAPMPMPMHTPVYQHPIQTHVPALYASRPLNGDHYPQPTSPHPNQVHGWNPTPYMYAPLPHGPPVDPYPQGWVHAPQQPPCAPPQPGPWMPSQYSAPGHYIPWGAFI